MNKFLLSLTSKDKTISLTYECVKTRDGFYKRRLIKATVAGKTRSCDPEAKMDYFNLDWELRRKDLTGKVLPR